MQWHRKDVIRGRALLWMTMMMMMTMMLLLLLLPVLLAVLGTENLDGRLVGRVGPGPADVGRRRRGSLAHEIQALTSALDLVGEMQSSKILFARRRFGEQILLAELPRPRCLRQGLGRRDHEVLAAVVRVVAEERWRL